NRPLAVIVGFAGSFDRSYRETDAARSGLPAETATCWPAESVAIVEKPNTRRFRPHTCSDEMRVGTSAPDLAVAGQAGTLAGAVPVAQPACPEPPGNAPEDAGAGVGEVAEQAATTSAAP